MCRPKLPPLLLASQSPRRQDLLRQVAPEFLVRPSNAEESLSPDMPPRALCELNARRKAVDVAVQHPEHLVVAADTLVFLDGRPLGKPASLDDARQTLAALSGRIHEVITGVCLAHAASRRIQAFSDVTRVRFRVLSGADIETYLARVHVLDKAGSYALQEEGDRLVERIEGSSSNVVGLPVESLRRALEQWRTVAPPTDAG